MTERRVATITHHIEPVLGSTLDCRVIARSRRCARRAVRAIVDDLERWEALLSAYRSTSELRRWVDGRLDDARLSNEVTLVLRRAAYWRHVTGGAVSPQRVDAAGHLGFDVDADGTLRRVGDVTGLRLDAFAKGFVIDRVVEAAMQRSGVVDVMVGIGGDIRAAGPFGVRVGVEHPGRPFDNEPPIGSIVVRNAGCATSGTSRRGEHLFDGRTGLVVECTDSAFVRAPTAEEADAWATHVCVTRAPPDDPRVDWMLFDRNGSETSGRTALPD